MCIRDSSYRGQNKAKLLLQNFIRDGGAIVDLEYITCKNGSRLISMSHYAGIAGCIEMCIRDSAYSGSLFPSICQNYIPIGCFCYTSAPLSNEIYSRILPKCSGFYDSRNIMYFARKIEGNRILVGSLGYLPNQDPNIKSSFANRLFKKLFGFDPSFNWNNSWDGTIGYTTDNLPRFMEISKNVFSIFGCLLYTSRCV